MIAGLGALRAWPPADASGVAPPFLGLRRRGVHFRHPHILRIEFFDKLRKPASSRDLAAAAGTLALRKRSTTSVRKAQSGWPWPRVLPTSERDMGSGGQTEVLAQNGSQTQLKHSRSGAAAAGQTRTPE